MRKIEAQDETFFSAPPRTAAVNGRVGIGFIQQFEETMPEASVSGQRGSREEPK